MLSSNSKVIFVSGWGGLRGACPKAARESCWKLTSFIYDVGGRRRGELYWGLLSIANKSPSPVEANDENVRELQEMLWEMPLDEDGITRVIFAHSHGAKIAFESLKKEKLDLFLKIKGLNDEDLRLDRMNRIRDHLAVFTLGGIQDIPQEYARVVRNLALPDDAICKAGKVLFQEKSTKEQILTAAVIVSTVMAAPTPVGAAVVSAGSSMAVSASVSSSSGRHYVGDYIDSAEIMNEIMVALRLTWN